MFDVFCPNCRRRQLIFPSQIRDIRNDESGIHVGFGCWCGQRARVTTGRAATELQEPALPVAG